jgi:hypothetical protein
MSKNKMIAGALLVAVAASVASAAFAASSTEPSQIPGYDRSGNIVPLPNPDRS